MEIAGVLLWRSRECCCGLLPRTFAVEIVLRLLWASASVFCCGNCAEVAVEFCLEFCCRNRGSVAVDFRLALLL